MTKVDVVKRMLVLWEIAAYEQITDLLWENRDLRPEMLEDLPRELRKVACAFAVRNTPLADDGVNQDGIIRDDIFDRMDSRLCELEDKDAQ